MLTFVNVKMLIVLIIYVEHLLRWICWVVERLQERYAAKWLPCCLDLPHQLTSK